MHIEGVVLSTIWPLLSNQRIRLFLKAFWENCRRQVLDNNLFQWASKIKPNKKYEQQEWSGIFHCPRLVRRPEKVMLWKINVLTIETALSNARANDCSGNRQRSMKIFIQKEAIFAGKYHLFKKNTKLRKNCYAVPPKTDFPNFAKVSWVSSVCWASFSSCLRNDNHLKKSQQYWRSYSLQRTLLFPFIKGIWNVWDSLYLFAGCHPKPYSWSETYHQLGTMRRQTVYLTLHLYSLVTPAKRENAIFWAFLCTTHGRKNNVWQIRIYVRRLIISVKFLTRIEPQLLPISPKKLTDGLNMSL